MTLDISKIANEIDSMAAKIKADRREGREHLDNALVKIKDKAVDLEKLKKKIKAKTYPWPAAELYEELGLHQAAPVSYDEYSVLATDGSHIAADRHQAARCFLINIGTVKLQYGKQSSADLDSFPTLYSEENELLIREEKNKQRTQQIEGALLDARRSVEEVRKLAQMTSGLPKDGPVLALLDGSLVLFGLESFPGYVLENLLDRGFFPALDELEKASRTQLLSLASYISLPNSSDVTNVLRLAICPQERAECDTICAEGISACDIISGINDRRLFAELLAPGERSALFINPSHILERYGRHRVYFFYLRGEEEIARVEIPAWVAMRKDLVDMTHALVLDQCRRGQGYPVALSEAHEKAVVTGADRQEFWELVEAALEEKRLPTNTSIKSRSKRTRWI